MLSAPDDPPASRAWASARPPVAPSSSSPGRRPLSNAASAARSALPFVRGAAAIAGSACEHRPQTANPFKASKPWSGRALLMAVLEGRAPNRRPHHAGEVGVTACRQHRSRSALWSEGGPLTKFFLCSQDNHSSCAQRCASLRPQPPGACAPVHRSP